MSQNSSDSFDKFRLTIYTVNVQCFAGYELHVSGVPIDSGELAWTTSSGPTSGVNDLVRGRQKSDGCQIEVGKAKQENLVERRALTVQQPA